MNLNLAQDRLWKGGAYTKPVPLGQATGTSTTCRDRLCLSQWNRKAACTKPVPLGIGKVKRDLSLSHGTSHIPTLEAFPCLGTSCIPMMELVPVPIVPTCSTKWVYKAVNIFSSLTVVKQEHVKGTLGVLVSLICLLVSHL